MAPRRSEILTEVELEFMDVVWDQGEATARDVLDALYETKKPAESTVRTMLRIMERKGYLTHRVEGRTYIYRPALDRDEATRQVIRHLADRISKISKGSADPLVKRILEVEEISSEELEEIKRWIEEKAREQEDEA